MRRRGLMWFLGWLGTVSAAGAGGYWIGAQPRMLSARAPEPSHDYERETSSVPSGLASGEVEIEVLGPLTRAQSEELFSAGSVDVRLILSPPGKPDMQFFAQRREIDPKLFPKSFPPPSRPEYLKPPPPPPNRPDPFKTDPFKNVPIRPCEKLQPRDKETIMSLCVKGRFLNP